MYLKIQKVIQKTAEGTGGLIGKNITDQKSQKLCNSIIQKQQINMIKKYLTKEERQKIIDDLRLR